MAVYVWYRVCADGDKKAYRESSQWTIQQNKDIISQLRLENKMLRAKLSKKMMVSEYVSAALATALCPAG